jgi:hypothetical protein
MSLLVRIRYTMDELEEKGGKSMLSIQALQELDKLIGNNDGMLFYGGMDFS